MNNCNRCYYHDAKENVCTHGSPIFIDDVCTDYQDSEFVMQIRADALNEYATMLMCVFSHSCEFYYIGNNHNIEAIEKQYIDDVILKCLAKVREDKGGNNGKSINN